MSVRARFYIHNVQLNAGDTAQANLSAVSRGKENSEWSSFTPGGNLTLSLSRKASGAKDFFVANIGREVYLDITLADDPICTQCGEPVQNVGGDYGTGVHAGAEGYVPDEYVHSSCLAAAKERLGIA